MTTTPNTVRLRRLTWGVLLSLSLSLAACSGAPAVEEAAPATANFSFPTSAPLVGPQPGGYKHINLPSGREFILSLPKDYSADKQWPVILGFHGWKETAWQMYTYTNFDASEAIVVFPQGIDGAWAPAPYARTSGEEDLDFVLEIIDSLRATYSVDEQHIHAVGMSNGGGFAEYLACHAQGAISSVASVSAAFYYNIHDSCADVPVSRLDIHGTEDPVVSYNGGTRHGAPYRSVREVLEQNARRNGCSTDVEEEALPKDSVRFTWQGCAAPLEHIKIVGGTHVWPGGAYDFDNGLPAGFATDAVLDFFSIPGRIDQQTAQ